MIFSNTEFYYAEPQNVTQNEITIFDDEAKHIATVMRHKIGDELFVTDGNGFVYQSKIKSITKNEIQLEVFEKTLLENILNNFTFFIPILKSIDRFEFALEKCVELGITNFIIFSAAHSVKKSINIDRYEKKLISAMKQSLRSFKPKLTYLKTLKEFKSLNTVNIFFEQTAQTKFSEFVKNYDNNKKQKFNLIFGPEGGLSPFEINLFENATKVFLTDNRLRAETAIISAASLLSTKFS
jgi:16S rRNA (uracil1498-N3)-methyltransferase